MNGEFFFYRKGNETKYRLFKALSAGPLSTLSIDQICEHAGIAKSTFYNHFQTKWDIPLWFRDVGTARYLYSIGPDLSWVRGYASYFTYLAAEKEVLTNIYNYNLDIGSLVRSIDESYQMISSILAMREVDIDESMRFSINAFSCVLNNSIMDWFRTGFQTDSWDFAKLLRENVSDGLVHAWEMPAKHNPLEAKPQTVDRFEPLASFWAENAPSTAAESWTHGLIVS